MAYRITYVLEPLCRDCACDATRSRAEQHLLGALTRSNEAFLRAHPEVPSSEDARRSGRVSRAPHLREWRDVASMLRLGAGNDASLACWRAAERSVREAVPSEPRPNRAAKPRDWGRQVFALGVFERAADRGAVADAFIAHCLRALMAINVDALRRCPDIPLLYQSGVRYEEEPPGQDDWQDAATTLAATAGDCEDLACWRAAELRVRSGVAATPVAAKRHRRHGGLLYHIQVQYPPGPPWHGAVEDPSRRLGMR